MNLLRRISQALARLNRRLAAGSTGGTTRDITMVQEAEREQFDADEDEQSEKIV